jgi:hypothetical protein
VARYQIVAVYKQRNCKQWQNQHKYKNSKLWVTIKYRKIIWQPDTNQLGQWKRYKFLASTLFSHDWIRSAIDKTTAQQLIHITHSDHKRCWKSSLCYACIHSLHLCKMLIHMLKFLSRNRTNLNRETWNFKHPLLCKAVWGVSSRMFKPSIDTIQHLSVSTQVFSLLFFSYFWLLVTISKPIYDCISSFFSLEV